MSNKKYEVAKVTEEELSLVEGSLLNKGQLSHILKKTPAKYVRSRPAKGGGTWDYVTGAYAKKVLNLMFGFNWNFEILHQEVMHGEAIIKGRLTINTGGEKIIKEQFGNKDIVCKKGTRDPLSIGNDLKSAATDCLKKCASELGLFADIYGKEDFKEVKVVTNEEKLEEIETLLKEKEDQLKAEDLTTIEEIIDNKRASSYNKVLKLLNSI